MHPETPDPRSASARPHRPGPRKRVGLSPLAEARLKRRLRLTTCSEPWVEAQLVSVDDRAQAGDPITYRYHDPKLYPPGGVNTAMIRCTVCGVFTPPNATEHGQCLDHARHAGYGPSPSALAIEALRFYHVRLQPAQTLPPEDAKSLRREIQKYERRVQKREKLSTVCGLRKPRQEKK